MGQMQDAFYRLSGMLGHLEEPPLPYPMQILPLHLNSMLVPCIMERSTVRVTCLIQANNTVIPGMALTQST